MNEQALFEQSISKQLENMLVERNLRGMKNLQAVLPTGYCLRAANILRYVKGTVLIGTGFPVVDTFETDGPVGALILYRALEILGASPVLICTQQMANAFQQDYRTYAVSVGNQALGLQEARHALKVFNPQAVVAIECPGVAANGRYHNMRGEDISSQAACFDFFINEADCPTIAIGDGGNEIGMGNATEFLSDLDIIPAITRCDQLIISDVSNWGVYGLLAFLSIWSNHDLLNETCPEQILKYI